MFGALSGMFEYINGLNAHYAALSYEEQKAMTIVERLSIYNWSFELCALGLLALVVLAYKVGTSINVGKAKKVMTSVNLFLNDELCFAKVGIVDPRFPTRMYNSERQNTWFTTFATGRSAIASIRVNLHLPPLNNPFTLFIEGILAYAFPVLKSKELESFIEVVIRPNGIHFGSTTQELTNDKLKARKDILAKFKFITAVVNKHVMNEVRDDHYFLSLCATTDNDALPQEYVFMSEMNQLNGFITNYLSKTKTPLNEALKQSNRILEFIAFTDLPSDKPFSVEEWNEETHDPRILIRTAVPNSTAELEALNKLISVAVEVYDNYTAELSTKGFAYVTNDMLKKSNNMRTQELEKLVKAAKMKALEEAKEKKLAEEKERRRQLKGTTEQQKLDQKMKEKRERRQRNKQKVRM
ncbi:uncharacterized protein GWK60_M10571 [Nakaseomyces glabratus]|nr:Protein of unknown function (DUF1682) [Nakaseomyces glabratus]QNG17171.1 uncharacterized protein GWK60_M10571 [Nakaseomyces glabratus]